MENIDTKLESMIDRVVVYQQGAMVTRTGSVELEPGTYDVIIVGLPSATDRDSIRVKGRGSGTILNINVKEQFAEKYSKEEVNQMEVDIKRLDQETAVVQESISLQETKIAKMATARGEFFQQVGGWYAAGEIEVNGIDDLNDALGNIQNTAVDSISALGDQLEDLQRQRDVLLRKLQTVRDRSAVKRFWEVHIIMAVEVAGEISLDLAYQVPNAGWQALYDAHIEEGQVNLKIIANVWNSTEEDWNDILVEVSTATLTAISAVKPTPLILRQFVSRTGKVDEDFKARRRPMGRKAGGGLLAPAAPESSAVVDGLLAPSLEPAPAPEVAASLADAMGVQSYNLPERISIPSEKTPHPVVLTNATLESSKKLFWSSTQPQLVVAQDVVTNGDLLLLPGKVKSYYEGEYVGETSIAAVAPKETFKLGSRLSYEVKVTKKLVDRSRAKQAVKGRFVQHYEYEMIVENLSKVDAPLKIYDRIPHSNSDKIKIEPDFSEFEPTKKPKLGVIKWKMDLKDVDSVSWKYRYAVNYDKNITIDPPLP